MRGFTALAQAGCLVAEPGPFFVDDAAFDSYVDEGADVGDPFIEEDVEFCCLKWGRAFIFCNLHLNARSHFCGIVSALDAGDAADIHANRGVEFQRSTASCCLGIAEHDADFFADLVDEDRAGVAARKGCCQFS